MKIWLKRFAVMSGSALLLTGCSLFSSEEDVVEMAELPVFEATYQPQIAWQENISDGVDKYYSQLQPVADNKNVYAASRNGEVKAFSINSGKLLWSSDFSEHESNKLKRSARFSGGISIALDTLFIGTENAQVLAIDKDNGKLKWLVKVTGEVVAQPVYSAGKVVVYTTRGDLIALDSATGETEWTLTNKQPKLTLRGSATPSISQGGIVYGRADGFVSVALLETGQALWQLPVARPYGATELDRLVDADMQPIISNNVVYTLAYNGNLVAIDLLKGQQLWDRKYSGFTNIALSGGVLYLSDYRGYVYAVDSKSGEELWSNKQLAYRNVTGVVVANEYIVVGDSEGYLHWINREDGQFAAQQELDSDGLYMEPFAAKNHLFLQTRSGKIIAIEKPAFNK
ncbi:outer membrane protein assembly factor BamB [Psychromonas aquimarina]|uniref:outer membrane protein assembly factor BamB n=1 Tax=Psychromonas aquimarina TaxID=444919 RepID=UPI000426E868|nr:outer membrane protein assembly factor BamB [Psychromonas aquimarina]